MLKLPLDCSKSSLAFYVKYVFPLFVTSSSSSRSSTDDVADDDNKNKTFPNDADDDDEINTLSAKKTHQPLNNIIPLFLSHSRSVFHSSAIPFFVSSFSSNSSDTNSTREDDDYSASLSSIIIEDQLLKLFLLSSTLQFSSSLELRHFDSSNNDNNNNNSNREFFESALLHLITNTKYFCRSLRSLKIPQIQSSSFSPRRRMIDQDDKIKNKNNQHDSTNSNSDENDHSCSSLLQPQHLSLCLRSFAKLRPLTKLDVSGCSFVTDAFLNIIVSNLTLLKSLNLDMCWNITDGGFCDPKSPLGRLKSLQELNLDYCRNISDKGVAGIASSLTSLTSLNLSYCDKITDTSLECLAKSSPSLQTLRLWRCSKITDVGLVYLRKICSLRHLDLSDCWLITDLGLTALATSLKWLKSLELYCCDKITDAGVAGAIATKCSLLQRLDLSFCDEVSDVSVAAISTNLKWLQVLELRGCDLISDEGAKNIAKLSSLLFLNLGYCSRISPEGVRSIWCGCYALQKIDLSYCSDAITDDDRFLRSDKMRAYRLGLNPIKIIRDNDEDCSDVRNGYGGRNNREGGDVRRKNVRFISHQRRVDENSLLEQEEIIIDSIL